MEYILPLSAHIGGVSYCLLQHSESRLTLLYRGHARDLVQSGCDFGSSASAKA